MLAENVNTKYKMWHGHLRDFSKQIKKYASNQVKMYETYSGSPRPKTESESIQVRIIQTCRRYNKVHIHKR